MLSDACWLINDITRRHEFDKLVGDIVVGDPR